MIPPTGAIQNRNYFHDREIQGSQSFVFNAVTGASGTAICAHSEEFLTGLQYR
jgi:hypothetical protein